MVDECGGHFGLVDSGEVIMLFLALHKILHSEHRIQLYKKYRCLLRGKHVKSSLKNYLIPISLNISKDLKHGWPIYKMVFSLL